MRTYLLILLAVVLVSASLGFILPETSTRTEAANSCLDLKPQIQRCACMGECQK